MKRKIELEYLKKDGVADFTGCTGLVAPDDPEVKEMTEELDPAYRVFITELCPKFKLSIGEEGKDETVMVSDVVTDCIINEINLYDLSSRGKAMYITVGREHDNHLNPLDGYPSRVNVRKYKHIRDRTVIISRYHGIVFLDMRGDIFYKDGMKEGSKNGTWLNGVYNIQNKVIRWEPGVFLGFGSNLDVIKDGMPRTTRCFKLSYERLR